jgi:hypothetical protein
MMREQGIQVNRENARTRCGSAGAMEPAGADSGRRLL